MRPHYRTRPSALLALSLALVTAAGALVVAPSASAAPRAGEVVKVSTGAIRGTVGLAHREFLGIPYAAPPTGERRFRPPAPAASWSGVRDAKVAGKQCPQKLPGASSEDCLVVDVFTPPAHRSRKLPVMVWFHGGSYEFGSANGYNPTPMVTGGNVIVVGVNYRLGPFGFLAHPGLAAESGTTGNYGLLDQQAALRWVQRNAAAFGGDPGNVTIYGQSAGGHAVCMQLISPGSAGLFHKAITMSGGCVRTILGPPPAAQAYRTGADLAASVGCTDAATAVACLRSKPAEEINAKAETILGGEFDNLHWRPVIDGNVLKEPFAEAVTAGRYHKVPLMVGTTKDEGTLFLALQIHLQKLRSATAAELEVELRKRAGAHVAEARTRYRAASPTNADAAGAALITDALFACPAAFTTRIADGQRGQRVWQYEFADPNPPLSDIDPIMPLGDYHVSELSYLFLTVQGLPAILNERQKRLARQMVSYWSTFARTGNPNGLGTPTWPEYQAESARVQRLTSTGTAPTSDFERVHHCDLWKRVAEL